MALKAFAFGRASGMMAISQVPPILQEGFAMTAARAAGFVSLMSLMSMPRRFLWGAVTDCTGKYVTLPVITGLPAVTMGVLASSPSETRDCHGPGGAITPVTAGLFGSKRVTENYGVMRAVFGHDGDCSGAFMMARALSVIAFLRAPAILKIRRNRAKPTNAA